MRVIFAAILTTAAIATPAAAQYAFSPPPNQSFPQAPSIALTQQPATEARAEAIKKPRSGAGAYAQAPTMQRRSLQSERDVYVNGVYVGSDPDPRIRETLRREFLSESNSR